MAAIYAEFKGPGLIPALLNAGAELNARNTEGAVPLHYAAHYNDLDAVTALLDAGANPNVGNEAGETPLHAVALRGPRGLLAMINRESDRRAGGSSPRVEEYELKESARSVEILLALLRAGAQSSARDKSGRTPLHHIAQFSPFPDMIDALLDVGTDATTEDHEGRTAYDLAAENPQLEGSNAFWRLNDARFD